MLSDYTLSKLQGSLRKSLLPVERQDDGFVVTLPVLYPSGSTVALRVSCSGKRYVVTDMAMGAFEAGLFDGEQIYKRRAAKVAEANGMEFQRQELYLKDQKPEQLAGALIHVAHASQEAVRLAHDEVLRLAQTAWVQP